MTTHSLLAARQQSKIRADKSAEELREHQQTFANAVEHLRGEPTLDHLIRIEYLSHALWTELYNATAAANTKERKNIEALTQAFIEVSEQAYEASQAVKHQHIPELEKRRIEVCQEVVQRKELAELMIDKGAVAVSHELARREQLSVA